MLVGLLLALFAGSAHSDEFRTINPLKSFIDGAYPLGSDYFINGNEDTDIFRCMLTTEKDGLAGIALSEISIWGNRTGTWEIFRQESRGEFTYIGTKTLTDTACLETCRSKEYLATGQCRWRQGWPK